MQKRIIEFVSSLGDGGAETLVKDYAIMLNELGLPTEILTVYKVPTSSNLNRAADAGISVQSILPGNSRCYKLLKQSLGFIYIPLRVYLMVKKNKVTGLHVHMNQLHHISPIMRYLKGVKVFYTCHNTPSRYFSGISGWLEKKAVAKMVKYDNFRLIALHEEMAEELKNMFYTNKIVVVRNGVDFNRFVNLKISKTSKRQELGITENAFVVGNIGRFSKQKNHLFLVDVFSEIKKMKENAFLLLIGDGILKEEIIEKLHLLNLDDSFLVLSHRTDIPELLSTMDVFLFPSLYEGLPVSLIEAQVSKKRCVVADTINESACLLPSTTRLSLDVSKEKWANECIIEYDDIKWNDALLNYDMNQEIIRLKTLLTE